MLLTSVPYYYHTIKRVCKAHFEDGCERHIKKAPLSLKCAGSFKTGLAIDCGQLRGCYSSAECLSNLRQRAGRRPLIVLRGKRAIEMRHNCVPKPAPVPQMSYISSRRVRRLCIDRLRSILLRGLLLLVTRAHVLVTRATVRKITVTSERLSMY